MNIKSININNTITDSVTPTYNDCSVIPGNARSQTTDAISTFVYPSLESDLTTKWPDNHISGMLQRREYVCI